MRRQTLWESTVGTRELEQVIGFPGIGWPNPWNPSSVLRYTVGVTEGGASWRSGVMGWGVVVYCAACCCRRY